MNPLPSSSSTRSRWSSLAALLLLATFFLSAASCKKESSLPAIVVPPPAKSAVSVPAADAVVYEAYVRSASPSGTFSGLTDRLDSIRKLGCNVLWLMPVHPTGILRRAGSLGSPYSVRDYRAVNPEFGTMADFDRLVAAAHQRGMAVILDWVANHTAWDNPWITQHPDWYTRDSSGKILSPEPTWQDVADLNYDRPALHIEMRKAMRFWVEEHNVDGFRCDVADWVPATFWATTIDSLRQVRSNLFWLAEGSDTRHYSSGFQLIYGWDFYTSLKQVLNENANVSLLTTTHTRETQGLPPGKYRLRFTTNHDFTFTEGPPVVVYRSSAAARAAYVATLAYGATPLIYNGQEVDDPTRLSLFEKSTINWSTDPTTKAFYRKVLALYDSLPALRAGALSATTTSGDVATVLRTSGTRRAAVFVNMRNRDVTVTVPVTWPAASWVDAFTDLPVSATSALTLPPYGYAVWKTP